MPISTLLTKIPRCPHENQRQRQRRRQRQQQHYHAHQHQHHRASAANAQNTHSQPNAVGKPVAPHTPTAANTRQTYRFLAQVFGIFGPSFWDFWLRNWTKNLVQKLHQKRGQATGIDAKTLRGNQFKMRLQKIGLLWRAYTKSTWTKFLVQFLHQILAPGAGPRFWTNSGPSFWSNS